MDLHRDEEVTAGELYTPQQHCSVQLLTSCTAVLHRSWTCTATRR